MKRKILVPMFASVMALSMNTIANADEVNKDIVDNKENKVDDTLQLGEYKETTYKKAVVKDGVGVKIREQGSVQHIAYSGDEFDVIATQGEWVKVKIEDSEGWLPSRFIDIKEGLGFANADKVNFRKEANTDCEIIEELSEGTAVRVLEDDGSWLKVKKGEHEGYIRSLYVSDKAPVIEEEVVAVANNTDNSQTSNTNRPNTNTNNNANTNTNNNTTNNNVNNNTNNNNNVNNNTTTSKPENTQKPSQDNNESYNPPTSNTSLAQAVVNLAYAKIGSPYVWGAEGPNSFDCSGLTSYVYRNAAGISLPRTSSAQSGYGQTVSKANLQPGDLVFFTTNGTGNVSHVGIYVGGGNMVHSPAPGQTVHVASIHSSYYAPRFVTAKRVL